LFYVAGLSNTDIVHSLKSCFIDMANIFRAIYHDELNHFYNAEIFISSVTVTMRYKNEQGQLIERNWLGEDIHSLEEGELQSTLYYRNESGKPEKLVIRDRALLEHIKHQFRHRKFAGKKMHYSTGKTGYRILAILLAILLVVGCIYFFFVPWLGERIALGFSKEKEINLGDQMYRAIISNAKVDQHKTNVLNKFYGELHYDISYPVKITVIKSDEVNAFAIPGGHIVVYDGILEGMKTPGQLAALLGHEASHIRLRHSLRNIFRSMARKMFLLIILGGDAGIAGYLVDQADDLKGLQYSRKLETEADDNGIRLMRNSGLNPDGMLQLMELLAKEGADKETSALLSTHPVFESRIKNIRQQLRREPVDVKSNPHLAELFHQIYETGNSY
jgi:Zn-dependent protease with chaperone function